MATEQTLATLSAQDKANAAAQPSPVPAGWEDYVFQTPDLPVGTVFTLRDLSKFEEYGPYSPDDWVTNPTTGITSAHEEDGQPFILRVLKQWEQNGTVAMECVNDEGDVTVLSIHPIDDNTLPVDGLELP